MPNLIVSTCGTSLLTNGAKPCLRSLLTKHANAKEDEIPKEDLAEIDNWVIETRLQELVGADEAEAARLSAELNGLLAYYRDLKVSIGGDTQDQHYLVVTDTHVGELAFQCISAWLKGRGRTAAKITARGLNTSDIGKFQVALAEIVKQFGDMLNLPAWRDRRYRVVFNLTGGFKSVNGFMQTIGMLFADECFYLFEGSPQLMRVPRLPIRLDAAGAFTGNLRAVRRMANGEKLTRADCGTLPETLLFAVSEDSVQLSEWGTALWIFERRAIYGNGLMEPLSNHLRFSDAFKSQVDARRGILCERGRLDTLNQRLDDLARWLDTKCAINPNHLDFKRIRGNPKPPCTHEFDIWSDRENRGYGHYENVNGGRAFVVRCIGGHL